MYLVWGNITWGDIAMAQHNLIPYKQHNFFWSVGQIGGLDLGEANLCCKVFKGLLVARIPLFLSSLASTSDTPLIYGKIPFISLLYYYQ